MTDDLISAITIDLDTLEQSKLLEVAKHLQKESKRVHSFASTTSYSSNCSPPSSTPVDRYGWIRASRDDPYDKEWASDNNVLGYDRELNSLRICNRQHFSGSNSLVIYCRLPSKLKPTIYVYKENGAVSRHQLRARFRVSTNPKTPRGCVSFCQIPLSTLGWKSRLKIWLGRVQWLFIVSEAEKRQATFMSTESEKTPPTS